jgi:hypothetical protein
MDIRQQRSISGMVFFLAGAVIAWKTRVQPTFVLSTEESEFLAALNGGGRSWMAHFYESGAEGVILPGVVK